MYARAYALVYVSTSCVATPQAQPVELPPPPQHSDEAWRLPPATRDYTETQDPIGSATPGQLDAAAFTAMPRSITMTHTHPCTGLQHRKQTAGPMDAPLPHRPRVLAVRKHAQCMRGATMYPRRKSQAAHLCAAIPRIPDYPADIRTTAHRMPPPQHPSAPSAYPPPPSAPSWPPLHTSAALVPPSAPFGELPLASWPSSRHLAPSAPFVHPRHLPSPFHTLSLPS
ncbi:hypothetical protein K439DRAFT_1624857 [Ramaria rubella]|nr:hypothetical protein K439DRAFT_1624857 [Ramaria rubella]